MKTLLCYLTLCSSCLIFSQEFFISYGGGNSKYVFYDSNENKDDSFKKKFGSSYLIGYYFPSNRKLKWGFSLIYDEHNSEKKINQTNYEWTAGYLTLGPNFNYTIFNFNNSFSLNSLFDIGFGSIINGEQRINLDELNIVDHPEFKGMFINSSIGFGIDMKINTQNTLYFGYKFNVNKRLSNSKSISKIDSFNKNSFILTFFKSI